MITNAFTMVKTTWKLILRTKSFLVFGLLIPLMSTLFINLWGDSPVTGGIEEVYELSSVNEQIVYAVDYNRYPVKIYDTLMDDYSYEICNSLNSTGIFQVFRANASSMSDEEIKDSCLSSAKTDRIGAVLIIRTDADDTELFKIGEDERFELLDATLRDILTNGVTETGLSEIGFVSGDGTEVDYYEVRNFAYCMAIGSLAFVFGGILILSTFMAEKRDKVYDRIMLTKADRTSYLASKLILSVMLTLVQTTVMTLCFRFLTFVDIGISTFQFFTILFFVGLVFDLLSLCIGLYFDSVASASVIAFVLWSTSSLLSGSYFDISTASRLYKQVAMLMPQRWALFSASDFMNGNMSGYSMILCASVAYLIIIAVAGIIGLRVREE